MQRRTLLKLAASGSAGLLVPGLQAAPQSLPLLQDDHAFTHPGLLHSKGELSFVKTQVRAGKQPWARHWQRLETAAKELLKLEPKPYDTVKRGPSNRPDVGSTELLREACAAYTLSLAWCLSGEKAYAKKATGLLNAWSGKLTKLEGHDTKLLSGMAGAKLANAAELLRHVYSGWRTADQDRFEALLRDVFYKPIKDFYPTANGNWDASMIQAMLGMGIFLDDQRMFDRAANYYREGHGNGAIMNYFNDFGQCQESGRDQAHTQMGLGFLGCACEMAWKQGVDLYSVADKRLAMGFEYTAKYNLGHEVPYEPYTSVEGRYRYKRISDDSRGKFAPIYDRAFYHYHHREGLEMPFTREAAEQPVRTKSIHRGWAHFRWTDLLFVHPPDNH